MNNDVFSAALKEHSRKEKEIEKEFESYKLTIKGLIITKLQDIFKGHEEFLDLSNRLKFKEDYFSYQPPYGKAEYILKNKKYEMILLLEVVCSHRMFGEIFGGQYEVTCVVESLNSRFLGGGRNINKFSDIGEAFKTLTENWKNLGYNSPF
jgi:hypothetical protein